MQLHHYTECGLDNIYLANGFIEHETEYGKGVSVEDTNGLHEAISRMILSVSREMTGAEFRFLRLELDLSQRRLAELINANEQAVRRWEKSRNKAVKGAAERMLRVLYSTWVGNGDVKRMIEHLAELDAQPAPSRIVLQETATGWQAQGCITHGADLRENCCQ
jgi:putative transcriptional regulator